VIRTPNTRAISLFFVGAASLLAATVTPLPVEAAAPVRAEAPVQTGTPVHTETPVSDPIRVTYVTVEAVYVNAGKKGGLAPGDTLAVVGGDRAGVRVVVSTVSSHSAACRVVGEGIAVEVDDVLVPVHPRETGDSATEPAASPAAPAVAAAAAPTGPAASETLSTRGGPAAARKNRLSGYIDLEYRLLDDRGDAGSSWHQPGISGRIVVDNIGGSGLSFRFRETSRWSYRDQPPGGALDEQEFIHRLSELALVYGTPESPVEIAVGRTLSSRIRGLGYIDGGYFTYRIGTRYRFGVAGGAEPDPSNSNFDSENARAAVFLSFEGGAPETQRIASTVAFSGSYHGGTVSREFVYLQNAYSHTRRFVVYQSLEIDINRDWRQEAEGSSLSFSNFYLTSSFLVSPEASVDLSYDARTNVRDYRAIETPDSLFDESVRSGLRGGLSWSLPKNMHLRAFGGVQQGANDTDTQYASLMIAARHLIQAADRLSVRIAWSDTPSSTTYSPAATYWLRLARQTQMSLGGGGYLNSIRGVDDDNYYVQIGADQWLGSRYSISASARSYFGGSLDSIEFMARAGMSF